jgi:Spy/CpxP family protein refolding chaperone
MNLKRFSLLCAAALALTATSAFAQNGKPGKAGKPGQDAKPGQDGKPARRGNAMSPKALEKALDLTSEQMDKLKPAFKKLTDARKDLANVTDPKEKREKMMAATKDMMKSVEEVLTPEQKTKFDELKKKAEEAAKKGKKKKDGGS